MNVYLVDDDSGRHALMGELLNRLNARRAGITWSLGFVQDGESVWQSAESLATAVRDSEGLILLDIDLDYRDNDDISQMLQVLKGMFNEDASALSELEQRHGRAFAEFDRKPKYLVSAFILRLALIHNRPFVIVTKWGSFRDAADGADMSWPFCEMPRYVENRAEWNDQLDRLVGKITTILNMYDKAAALWRGLCCSVGPLFSAGSGFHSAKDWFIEIGNAQGKLERLSQLESACKSFCGHLEVGHLATECIVMLGRAASRKRLAVPFLEALLGLNCGTASPPVGVICDKVSAGRLAWAIRMLARVPRDHTELISVEGRIEVGDEQSGSADYLCTVKFVAKYRDQTAAMHAAETLSLTPEQRMLRDHERDTPGTAVEACNWLRRQAVHWMIRPRECNVDLEYRFYAEQIE